MPTLLEKKKAKLDEASKILADAGDDVTDEQLEQVKALRGEADDFQAQHDRKEQIREMRADIDGDRETLSSIPKRKTGREDPIVAKEGAREDPKAGFKDARQFYIAVHRAGAGGLVDDRLKPLAAVGSDEQSTFSDPDGGFLTPKAFSPNLLQVRAEADPLAGRVTNVPMETQVLDIPARVDKDHTSSVSGGLRVYRRAEADEVQSSRMKFEMIELKAMALMGLTYATEEIIARSPISIVGLLEAGFRDEFAGRLINERLNGVGGGEFTGVMNSPCLISVPKEGGQAADTIQGLNILKMRQRCWRYNDAVWLANPDTYVELSSVHIAGTNGDVFLFHPGNGTDVPDTLLGRPIFFTEYAKTLGDQGDLVLGTWSEFLEGTLQNVERAESMHVRFVNHERAFKFWMENAGAPWWRTALTPKNGANTLSPFVTLDARA